MKRLFILILAAFLLLTAAACRPRETGDGEKLIVVATVNALVEITRAIGGDRAEVVPLVPDGVEIHDFEPTPRDAETVQTADLIVLNGLGLEPWFENTALSETDAEICVAADSVVIATGVVDPHLWQSPSCAADMASGICDALSALDPDNADYYSANLEEFRDDVAAVYDKYRDEIEPGGVIVTTHASFGYLCRDLGITEVSLRGIFAEGEPSPRRLAELAEFCAENGVTRIFEEYGAHDDIAETLARECGAQVVTVYTMESAEDGKPYLERMEHNLAQIANS